MLTAASPPPRIRRPLDRYLAGIWHTKRPRLLRRRVLPPVVVVRPQDHRHAVVNLRCHSTRVGHNHRIAISPLLAAAPDPRTGEHGLIGQAHPGAGHGAFGSLGFRPRGQRDQAASLLEAKAPHEAVELVGARVIYWSGLERLARPFTPLRQREPPDHRSQRPIGHDQAGIAGVDLLGRVADRALDTEKAGDLIVRLRHAVQVADGRPPLSERI